MAPDHAGLCALQERQQVAAAGQAQRRLEMELADQVTAGLQGKAGFQRRMALL